MKQTHITQYMQISQCISAYRKPKKPKNSLKYERRSEQMYDNRKHNYDNWNLTLSFYVVLRLLGSLIFSWKRADDLMLHSLGYIFSIKYSFLWWYWILYMHHVQDCSRVLEVRRGLMVSTVLFPPTSLKYRVIKTLGLCSCGKKKKKKKKKKRKRNFGWSLRKTNNNPVISTLVAGDFASWWLTRTASILNWTTQHYYMGWKWWGERWPKNVWNNCRTGLKWLEPRTSKRHTYLVA